jgi:hypothetical protein
MDPITVTVVSALAAGAAAAAKDVATEAIKDAYAGLKQLIVDRYQRAAPFADAVEADPASKPEQKVLAKQLEQTEAPKDDELKAAAQALLSALQALRSEPLAAAMFDFDQLRALKNFELEDIEAAGTLLRARVATFEGDFKAKGIRQAPAGGSTEKH